MRALVAALSLAALASCGFTQVDHRAAGIPGSAIRIDIGERKLREEFTAFLGRRGVAVEEDARLRLRVVSSRDRDVVALTETGTVNKFRLKYRVEYSIALGEDTVNADTIVLREVVSHDESSHLAKREERENLYREMRRRIMEDLWFRIVRATAPA